MKKNYLYLTLALLGLIATPYAAAMKKTIGTTKKAATQNLNNPKVAINYLNKLVAKIPATSDLDTYEKIATEIQGQMNDVHKALQALPQAKANQYLQQLAPVLLANETTKDLEAQRAELQSARNQIERLEQDLQTAQRAPAGDGATQEKIAKLEKNLNLALTALYTDDETNKPTAQNVTKAQIQQKLKNLKELGKAFTQVANIVGVVIPTGPGGAAQVAGELVSSVQTMNDEATLSSNTADEERQKNQQLINQLQNMQEAMEILRKQVEVAQQHSDQFTNFLKDYKQYDGKIETKFEKFKKENE